MDYIVFNVCLSTNTLNHLENNDLIHDFDMIYYSACWVMPFKTDHLPGTGEESQPWSVYVIEINKLLSLSLFFFPSL